MFESIACPKAPGRSVGPIATSISIHGIAIASAVLLAYAHVRDRPVSFVDVSLRPWRPAGPAPAPAGHKPQGPRPERAKRKVVQRPILEPKIVPPVVEEALAPEESPVIADVADDAPDSEVGGEGVIGGVPGGVGIGAPEQGDPAPIEFNDEMAAPRMIDGRDPEYTREALEREIEGLMLVKCVVTTRGIVRNCRVLKSLPYMDREVIEALENRRYTPALLHGHPISVDYTFRVRLNLRR